MKVTCLLFLTMICAASMLGTGYAVASNPLPQQTAPESSTNTASERSTDAGHAAPADEAKRPRGTTPLGKPRNHHLASNANHARSYASVANSNRPKQFPKSQERVAGGNPANPNQPGPKNSGTVAKEGLMQNKPVSGAMTVRPPNMVPSSASSQGNVRHRGRNPAVVGGPASSLASSKTGNTGAINGTRMSRRP